ncbi:MAG TPA: hypothetical protein VK963_01410 [Candidatus Saccharimonadales bacterium]|nr:hypothetical protein [Candidatus Saccharimonadales bacterium]
MRPIKLTNIPGFFLVVLLASHAVRQIGFRQVLGGAVIGIVCSWILIASALIGAHVEERLSRRKSVTNYTVLGLTYVLGLIGLLPALAVMGAIFRPSASRLDFWLVVSMILGVIASTVIHDLGVWHRNLPEPPPDEPEECLDEYCNPQAA